MQLEKDLDIEEERKEQEECLASSTEMQLTQLNLKIEQIKSELES